MGMDQTAPVQGNVGGPIRLADDPADEEGRLYEKKTGMVHRGPQPHGRTNNAHRSWAQARSSWPRLRAFPYQDIAKFAAIIPAVLVFRYRLLHGRLRGRKTGHARYSAMTSCQKFKDMVWRVICSCRSFIPDRRLVHGVYPLIRGRAPWRLFRLLSLSWLTPYAWVYARPSRRFENAGTIVDPESRCLCLRGYQSWCDLPPQASAHAFSNLLLGPRRVSQLLARVFRNVQRDSWLRDGYAHHGGLCSWPPRSWHRAWSSSASNR